jgi:hypothetical protein
MAKKNTDLIEVQSREERELAVKAQFLQMATVIPEDEGDGGLRILEQIASASSVEDIDNPWNARGAEAYNDKVITITDVTRKDSDFRDGMGLYLLLDIIDVESGEVTKITSGSTSLVAQVIRLYTLDLLPYTCVVRVATKATKNGYYPQHLETLRATAAKVG